MIFASAAYSSVFIGGNFNSYPGIFYVTNTGTLTWAWGYTSATMDYFVRDLYLWSNSGNNYLFGCMQSASTSASYLGIAMLTMSSSNVVASSSNYFDTTTTNVAQCRGIFATSLSTIVAVVNYYDSLNVVLASVNFVAAAKTVTYTTLTTFS
jgi:hypothetical protein